jgi:hypothetical protein
VPADLAASLEGFDIGKPPGASVLHIRRVMCRYRKRD